MDCMDSYCFKIAHDTQSKAYTFVSYPMDFAPETVEAFLRGHAPEFDAVAVSAFPDTKGREKLWRELTPGPKY